MWKEGEGHPSRLFSHVGKVEAGSLLSVTLSDVDSMAELLTQPPVLTEEHNLHPAWGQVSSCLCCSSALSCCPQIPALLTSERPLFISTPGSVLMK